MQKRPDFQDTKPVQNFMDNRAGESGVGRFVSSSSFWFPDALVDSAWHQHAPFAFWLIETLRPRLFVELGAHHGFSYLTFCQAADRFGLGAQGYAIDTWQGDEHAFFYGNDVYERLRDYHEPRYGAFSRLVRSTFDEARNHFLDGSIDLLHIDGRHFLEDVKHDFESWKEKLSARAVVLFHDTNVRERGFGVCEFWAELRDHYPTFEFLHGNGLGVLGAGSECPDALRQLFEVSASPALNAEIREVYSRLGGSIEAHHQLAAEQARAAKLAQDTRGGQTTKAGLETLLAVERARVKDLERAVRHAQSLKRQARRRLADRQARQSPRLEMAMSGRAVSQDMDHRLATVEARLDGLEKKTRSSRWLLKETGYKLIHAPRDISRRARRSWRKRRGQLSPVGLEERQAKNRFRRLGNPRYRKYLSSRLALHFEPILPRGFADRMRRRMEKNAPISNTAWANTRELVTGPPRAKPDSVLFDQLFAAAKSEGQEYVPLAKNGVTGGSRIKAIAFYLPQFHPIPENDAWWGKGFTEWTNVSKAVPQFLGHYQPRLPGELGFYDLRVPEVMKRQVELAKHYGIYGFCFHYYWFTGRRRLLERPLNQFIANRDLDFPFCVCWANENWTRRWDGLDQEILMEQRYEPQDDLQFIEDLAPVLKDPRYIRVDGRPLIIIYRVDALPDAPKTMQTWREYCQAEGIGNPLIVAAQFLEIADPHPYGCDAAVQFPPHGLASQNLASELVLTNPDFKGQVFSYQDAVERQSAFSWPSYPLYRTVMPSWDNEARKPGEGRIFIGSTPALYRKWLTATCRATDEHCDRSDEKLVFINAWNEWGEGAYLEPDRRYGYAYLEATKHALAQFPPSTSRRASDTAVGMRTPICRTSDTAVILHLFYEDLWPEIVRRLDNLDGDFDLFVSTPDIAAAPHSDVILKDFPNATIVRLPNRGRDIAPFLELLRVIEPLKYAQICKIHSKRSSHRLDGDLWRSALLDALLGSRAVVAAIKQAFRTDPSKGLVGPAGHYINCESYLGSNQRSIGTLTAQLGYRPDPGDFGFFAGSMFWFRPEALRVLLDHVTQSDFEQERGQTDGTLAHALERLFAYVCHASGYRVVDTAKLGDHPEIESCAEAVLGCGSKSYKFDAQSSLINPHHI